MKTMSPWGRFDNKLILPGAISTKFLVTLKHRGRFTVDTGSGSGQ